jgi:hypothetical protein
MGRRSRKRSADSSTRAERDAARRERAAADADAGAGAGRPRPRPGRPSASERPPAPWGSFPLSELIIFIGIVVILWGMIGGGDQAGVRVAAGLVLASLGGGELALREHLAGFRSHSALLAGVSAFVVVTALVLGAGSLEVWLVLLIGVVVFAGAFYGFRELFKRRSGGLGFR